MNLGIAGSGVVGRAIAGGLLRAGNSVMLSSRDHDKGKQSPLGGMPSLNAWVEEQRSGGRSALAGSFREAIEFGEVVFNCTPGAASLQALSASGPENLRGKILVDVANPLDFSHGTPPTADGDQWA